MKLGEVAVSCKMVGGIGEGGAASSLQSQLPISLI